jgi:hypothetical protein
MTSGPGRIRGGPRKAAATAALALGATGLLAVAPSAQAALSAGLPTVAWVSPSGDLLEVSNTGVPMTVPGLIPAAGTSPATTPWAAGGRAVAVHAAFTNTLQFVTPSAVAPIDTGAVMAPGASPAVAGLPNLQNGGGAEAVFAGSDGFLREANLAPGTTVAFAGGGPLGVAPGTDPAVAADTSNGFEVAFHANGEDTLWWIDRSNVAHDSGIKIAAGTSPSITELQGTANYLIAFVRGTDKLPVVLDPATGSVTAFRGETVAAGSQPTIRDTGAASYTVAFVGGDDHALWRATSGGFSTALNIPIAAGTSPSIAFVTGGTQIMFNNGVTRTIWQAVSNGPLRDTHVPIAAGTSPRTANLFDTAAAATTFTATAPPPAPQGVAPTLNSVTLNGTTATLTYTDTSSSNVLFRFLRRDAAGGPEQQVGTAADTSGTVNRTLTFTDTIPAGTRQCYMVQNVFSGQIGDSNEVCTSPLTTPAPPANLPNGVSNALATPRGGFPSSSALGADGLGLIAYFDSTHLDLNAGHCADADCSAVTTTVLDNIGDVGSFLSMKIGSDGLGVIAYAQDLNAAGQLAFALKVAHCANTACTSATVTTLVQPAFMQPSISLTIGGDGNPLIGFNTKTDVNAATASIQTAHCLDVACASWRVNTIDTVGAAGVFAGPSVATGPGGTALLAYTDGSNGNHLKTAACGDPDCATVAALGVVDSVNNTGFLPTLAVGRDGLGLITYERGSGALAVAHCINVFCTTTTAPVTLDAAAAMSDPASITTGGDGLPLIAYHQSSTVDLNVAHCADLACGSLTSDIGVDQFGSVGAYPSAMTGPDGLPLITYYDGSNGNLKSVHCGDPACAEPIGTVFRRAPVLLNGGFEAGSVTGWTGSGAAIRMSHTSHTGAFAAQLGAATPTNGDSSLSQTFAIDTGQTTLSFWYNQSCPSLVTSDWATATLTDSTTGVSTVPLPKTCAASGWTQVTAPVIAGHTYTLTLTNHDDNSPGLPTSTLYDDVTLS